MDGRKYILVIDDNEVSRTILNSLFCEDYEILEAPDGKIGLDYLLRYCDLISVILLDLVMPEMNGYEFIEEMKKRNLISMIPVIVVSSNCDSAVEAKILDQGVSDMVSVPIVPNIVKRRVDNVINANNYRRSLESMTVDLSHELKKTNSMVFETLCSIIEQRSLESGQHIKRIRIFTEILLRQLALEDNSLNLDENTIDCISRASTLHDVGKIVIPDNILNKPDRFTAEEFEVMKHHTVEGAKIIRKLNFNQQKEYQEYAWQIAMYHHERWDGKGYPEGLKGDEIPLCAQAAGVADVYDALTTPRVYKPIIEHSKAIVMILSGECGAFSDNMKRALRAVASKFEECAGKFRDGEMELDSLAMQDDHLTDDVLDEAFRTDYYKYITSLQIIDGYVFEVDYDLHTYSLVYPTRNPFTDMPVNGDFIHDSSLLIRHHIHPDEQEMVSDHLNEARSSIESGHHINDSCVARMSLSGNGDYRWFQFSQVRIELPSVSKHKSLIVIRDLDKMVPELQSDKTDAAVCVPERAGTDSSDSSPSDCTAGVIDRLHDIGLSYVDIYDMFRSGWDVLFFFNIDTGAITFDYRLGEKVYAAVPKDIHELFHGDAISVHPDDEAYFVAILEMAVMGVDNKEMSFRLKSEAGNFIRFKGKSFSVRTERQTISHIVAVFSAERRFSE